MKIFFYSLKIRASSFMMRNKTLFNRTYWVVLILVVATIFIFPIALIIQDPYAAPTMTHGVPVGFDPSDWNRAINQAVREQSRLGDFSFMIFYMYENYPFFELAYDITGIDYMETAIEAFEMLQEIGRYDGSQEFFVNFTYDNFLHILNGLGNPRVTSHGRWGLWLLEPYFFGYQDWRFTDYRHRDQVPVHDDNVLFDMLTDNVAYMRVNTFLAQGYTPIVHHPYWAFDFDDEQQRIFDFYDSIYDVTHLIIDIRGINSGFGDYFLPLILEPNINESISSRFYAFHTPGEFAVRVSSAFRSWYGLDGIAQTVTPNFIYDIPENLTHSFSIDIVAVPNRSAFEGQVWLITDSENFSGPNFMYLQMARDAGFNIIYQEVLDSVGWESSFVSLPWGGLALKFNPLYFTDNLGRPLEAYGLEYHFRKSFISEDFNEVLALIR